MLIKYKYIYLKVPQYIEYTFFSFSKNKNFLKYIFKGPLGNIFNYFINNIYLNIILKNNFIFLFCKNKKIIIFLKLYLSTLKNIFKGLLGGFHMYIKLKGLSYRI
jgi:ribosomal protein L6P/L9E